MKGNKKMEKNGIQRRELEFGKNRQEIERAR